MTDETEVMWSPSDVAKRLRVSPSGLRRLAGVYAQVYGEIPTDSSSTSRRWPTEAVNRLEQARALMAVGQARSIRDALLAAQSGAGCTVGRGGGGSRWRWTCCRGARSGGGPAEGEQAVTANDGNKDQESGRSEADGLVVRVARWPELLLRSNS